MRCASQLRLVMGNENEGIEASKMAAALWHKLR